MERRPLDHRHSERAIIDCIAICGAQMDHSRAVTLSRNGLGLSHGPRIDHSQAVTSSRRTKTLSIAKLES